MLILHLIFFMKYHLQYGKSYIQGLVFDYSTISHTQQLGNYYQNSFIQDSAKKYIFKYIAFPANFASQGFSMRVLLFGYTELNHPKIHSEVCKNQNSSCISDIIQQSKLTNSLVWGDHAPMLCVLQKFLKQWVPFLMIGQLITD